MLGEAAVPEAEKDRRVEELIDSSTTKVSVENRIVELLKTHSSQKYARVHCWIRLLLLYSSTEKS